MGLFSSSTKFESLDDLFVEQLQDIYDAEQRLTKALPKMADAATAPALKTAFQSHLRETENQVRRLEQVFDMIGQKAHAKTCAAMSGLVEEGDEMVNAKGDPAVKDAALIAAAQRVEHYEMAAYGTARAFARQLGHTRAADLLQQSLDEEGETNKKLTALAEGMVNTEAARV